MNCKAWAGEDVFPRDGKKLDSSIKRNTGFIKKLKQGITKDSRNSLLKDLTEVSLEKYLSEVTTTTNEGLSKVSNKSDDISVAVEVISGLHQRFNERFSPQLVGLFLHNFTTPTNDLESERDELARINRLRSNIRVLTELYLVGVFRSLDDMTPKDALPLFISKKLSKKEPILFTVLKEILNYKFKTGITTTIATTFMKKFPLFFSSDDTSSDEFIHEPNLKTLVQSLFKIFTEAVFTQTTHLNKRLNKLMKEHQKAQIRTGKLTDEYLEEYQSLVPIFERFKTASTSLAESFEIEPPILDTTAEDDVSTDSPMITNQVKAGSEKTWENEEARRFYEMLPDISDVVKNSSAVDDEQKGEAVTKFFSDLEMAESKETIDDLSYKYWTETLDNKATRKRLLKFFIETQDWSKLRIYARFVATNSEFIPDVKEDLIKYLDNGFRSQLHSNRINVKNIIFFSEMVKFMLVPSFLIFHKIRTLIMNILVPNNIEILTVLFENFGRFLINKPEYKPHMEKMMDLIREKKKDHQLTINNKSALDSLIVLIYPPSLSTLNSEAKETTPEQQFYRILIRRELGSVEPKKAAKLLRKAHWDDPALQKTLFSLFTKPGKVSYQTIPNLAKVLSEIYPYYRNFTIKCIDTVLESIQYGLEINEYSFNMMRVAQIKYLTEIFNCELIRFEVLLDTLYKITKFGYPNGQPNPFLLNELDLPDNYFRIQLVTTALLNLQKTTPNLNKKITLFMRFFEYYILTKDQPLPKETQFKVTNTFDKFAPEDKFERCTELVESGKKLAETLQSLGVTSMNTSQEEDEEEDDDDDDDADVVPEEDDEEEEEEEEEDDDDDDDSSDGAISNESDSLEEDDSDDDDESSSSTEDESEDDDSDDDDDDDDYISADRDIEKKRMQEEYQRKLKDEAERKVEEDFEKQFQQLLQESLESRKNEKVTTNNIPMVSSGFSGERPRLLGNSSGSAENKPKRVAFTFLSKSGKKTSARTLALPSNLKFVSDVLEEEQKLRAEREKIKNIVLNKKFD